MYSCRQEALWGHISVSLAKVNPPNCVVLTGYHWSHLGPVVCKVQGVTSYQEQYTELVLGSAAVCFNKLYGLECDFEVVLHSGQVQEEAFYVFDIGDIVHKHREWKLKMSRIEPHYGKTESQALICHIQYFFKHSA
jgi:hypothetical protein